jgi:glycosyltransferase involved in cell wall biosynthesis
MSDKRVTRPLLIYWGRRGSLSRIVLDLATVAGNGAVFCVSKQNELFDQICKTGVPLIPIDGFQRAAGAILSLHQFPSIRRRIVQAIREHRINKVVVLMSHVWTPLLAATLPRDDVRYSVIVHDAKPHPGDPTGIVNRWLLQDAMWADEVVTLTRHVAEQLQRRLPHIPSRPRVLFHPVIGRGGDVSIPRGDQRIGFLFVGRLMAYKGLALFVEACRILRRRGHSFRVGVAGEGQLGGIDGDLRALDAEVVNRWIDHQELISIVGRYDAVVLAHTEASQSGVIPLAYGCGLPVIATPAGGLIEQIEHGRSGLLASEISAAAIAESMQRFLMDAELREQLIHGVHDLRERISIASFFDAITGLS